MYMCVYMYIYTHTYIQLTCFFFADTTVYPSECFSSFTSLMHDPSRGHFIRGASNVALVACDCKNSRISFEYLHIFEAFVITRAPCLWDRSNNACIPRGIVLTMIPFHISHHLRQIYCLYPGNQKLREQDQRVLGLNAAMLVVVLETGAQGCNNLYPII